MKILKYILALMLMLPFLASCDDDEVGNPNVSPQDFVTVSNRTARVSLDLSLIHISEPTRPY